MEKGLRMSLEILQKLNNHLTIFDIKDNRFLTYGRVIDNFDISEVTQYSAKIEIPESGNSYIASIQSLEAIPVIKLLSQFVYGGLEVQAGICVGHNKGLTGIEYHQGSETIIAIKDCVLILGKRQDMVGNTYDGSLTECFYVQKGQVVELYDTSLHYTPCKTGDYFMTIVILLKGTNNSIEKTQGILMKQNKWFITHPSIQEKVDLGNYPGLLGEIKTIN